MSSLEGKRVKYAALPQGLTVFVPRVGNLRSTLTSYHDGLNKGYDMTISDGFLAVSTTDEVRKPVTIYIPLTALTHFVLE